MPDPNNTGLIDFDGWTLRVRESSNEDRRLLVLVHGLTGDENSMWVFTRNLSPAYWMIAPRAPHVSSLGGYSWKEGTDSSDTDRPTMEQLRAGAEALISMVDEYSISLGIDAQTFDVMGFSQGGAVCSLLGFLYPARIGKTAILAGFVPQGLEEHVSRRPLDGKTIFVAHGTRDETIDVDRARASVAILEEAGAQVTYCEDEVGHKVSAGCLRALKEFFSD